MESGAQGSGLDRPQSRANSRARGNDALILIGLMAAAFSVAIAYMDGLTFPFLMDEDDYWDQTLEFISDWPPSLQLLRTYGEPMTPLSFFYWGAVELSFGLGVPGLRLSCLVLSVAALLLIGRRANSPGRRALLCGVGLLLYPYWVPLSLLIYTDMPAVFLSMLGLFLYARGRSVASAAAFVLAIATRQYMITVPLSLLAAELMPAMFSRESLRWERVIPLVAACGSLAGWVIFFGGLGPSSGLDVYPTHLDALVDFSPFYGLYMLSCVGAYFVVPEFALFRRWRDPWPFELSFRNISVGVGLLVAFASVGLPGSDVAMGPLNRSVVMLLPVELPGAIREVVRIVIFAALAWLTCVRFRHLDLVFWLLLSRGLLMTVSWEGWEKYHMVLLASLWYLRSLSELDKPLELFGLDARLDREANATSAEPSQAA